jgi:ATP phosphoribosyltransferase
LGLPKGRLLEDSHRFCGALGIEVRRGVLRYQSVVDGRAVTVHLLKMQDIARLLVSDQLHLGVVGDEWLMEIGSPPQRRILESGSYQANLCLITPAGEGRALSDLRLIASPYPRVAAQRLARIAPTAGIMAIGGSSEALVPDIADAAFDVVETGASTAANGLRVAAEFDAVTTHLVRSGRCPQDAAASVASALATQCPAVRR